MKDLVKMFEDLGFANVKTYLQSGNVVFQFKNEPIERLKIIIHEGIYNVFGFDVGVLVLTINNLKNILKNNPFKNDTSKDISFLFVTFLASIPENYDFNFIENRKVLNEEIEITDDTVYLYCPNGYGKTKLNNTFIEKRFHVTATTRNWKTTLNLLELAESIELN